MGPLIVSILQLLWISMHIWASLICFIGLLKKKKERHEVGRAKLGIIWGREGLTDTYEFVINK